MIEKDLLSISYAFVGKEESGQHTGLLLIPRSICQVVKSTVVLDPRRIKEIC